MVWEADGPFGYKIKQWVALWCLSIHPLWSDRRPYLYNKNMFCFVFCSFTKWKIIFFLF